VSRPPRSLIRFRAGLAASGAVATSAAIAVLEPNRDFALTFIYVACTFGVCAVATAVTIRVLARLMCGPSGDREAQGLVEIGLLIGLFVVSPLALTGAFELLQAVVGSP
jgi:hypothetical protein